MAERFDKISGFAVHLAKNQAEVKKIAGIVCQDWHIFVKVGIDECKKL